LEMERQRDRHTKRQERHTNKEMDKQINGKTDTKREKFKGRQTDFGETERWRRWHNEEFGNGERERERERERDTSISWNDHSHSSLVLTDGQTSVVTSSLLKPRSRCCSARTVHPSD
jgi:hypothetical protein